MQSITVFRPFTALRRFVALALTVVALAAPSAAPVQAAAYCQCTTYVASAFNLSQNYPNAQDWSAGYLQSQGFHQVSQPSQWAIAVFSGQYPNLGSSVGHVALVENVQQLSDGWRLTVRGANQSANSGNYWTEQNCSNISDWTLAHSVPFSSPYISYWVR
jgi:CHAP domain